MEDLIAQLADSAAALSPEEIVEQLEQCSNLPVEKIPTIAAWLSSLNA